MGKRILSLLIFLLVLSTANGQIGGENSYEFLSLPTSARVTALGGTILGAKGNDIDLAMANPAQLNKEMHQAITFNYNSHFASISNGSFAYGHYIDKWKVTTGATVVFANYGEFTQADEFGFTSGTFSGSETAIVLSAGKAINERMTGGVNLKFINSAFESYNSLGVAADIGINYQRPESSAIISLLIKNLGGELTTLVDTRYGAPLDIQIGYSKRLKHLPFRYSIIAHNLQRWDIRYDDPNTNNQTDIFGQNQEESAFNQGVDNFFRHLIFSGEFLLGKNENFNLRFGYNHLRRRELQLSEFTSFGGFSLGIGMKISKFNIGYGVGYHHLAGATNHLSIRTHLDRFRKVIKD